MENYNSPSTPPTIPPTQHIITHLTHHHPPYDPPSPPPPTPQQHTTNLPIIHPTPSPTHPTTTTTDPPIPTYPTPRTLQPPTQREKVGPLCPIFHGLLHIVYPFSRQIFGFPYLSLKLSLTLPTWEKCFGVLILSPSLNQRIFPYVEMSSKN